MAKSDVAIAIAGGSTAGLSTAIFARLQGLQVCVIEPRVGVMDKACGEGFLPGYREIFQALGLRIERSRALGGIAYRQADREAIYRFPQEQGLGVRRIELQRALRERAEELGVQFLKGKLQSFTQHPDHVAIELDSQSLRADWLLGADGLRSRVREQLGIEVSTRWAHRFGVRRHYAMKPWSDMVEVYWTPDCEVYVTPVDQDLVGVACLFFGSRDYNSCLQQLPELAARLPEPSTRLLGAGPFERRLREHGRGRVWLVGDAAGFLDPITGEGNLLAMRSARVLINCLCAGQPGRYEQAWRQVHRHSHRLTRLLMWAARHSLLRQQLVPTLSRFPQLMPMFLGKGLAAPAALPQDAALGEWPHASPPTV